MSVFDLPRVHFAGIGVTRLPTGPRSGLFDLAANAAVAEGHHVPADRPAAEHHAYLDRQGFRFEPDGTRAREGRFGSVKGWNFGGNGHFWVDASVTSCEREPGLADTADPLVGRQLDLWGHYNEAIGTTANRGRVFDVDPASSWTTAVLVGQFALGRLGRSHDVGYLAIGDVHGTSPPRWHNARHVLRESAHPLAHAFRRSVVHQFVVRASDRLFWSADSGTSPALSALREAVATEEFGGLVVQLALFNMATPVANDAPDRWQLRGTIAPWRPDELRTYPAGRLLTGRRRRLAGRSAPVHNLTVRIDPDRVTANLITALPAVSRDPRPGTGPLHRLGPPPDLGDLELRTASGRLIAVLPAAAYLGGALETTAGVLTVPRADGRRDDPQEELHLLAGDGTPLVTEEEVNVQSDDASLFVEYPDARTGRDFATDVTVRSFLRGRPAAVEGIEVHQFFNPRALPLDPRATAPTARPGDIRIADLAPAGAPAEEQPAYAARCTLATDGTGRAVLRIRGAAAGAAQLLLLPPGRPLPCNPDVPGSAAVAYDDEDRLGYWPTAGTLSVRVLPDHWHLTELDPDGITFDVLYREVLAPYELMYSFMKDEVFSFEDAAKVVTYARLMWLMADPRHRDKTFYMPSTRDMTAPQTQLLLAFMRRTEATRQRPPAPLAGAPRVPAITTREQLAEALRQAATIELAVMLQYLYALWSIPTYSAGLAHVERGTWTPAQLRLLCGEGPHSTAGGLRETLQHVAREEMIHFLVVNNIIMATGQPFHLPEIDFSTVNHHLPVPLDLSLEAFGRGSLQRFIALEQPHALVRDIASPGGRTASPPRDGSYPYGSLSELYAAIREGLRTIDGLFLVEPGRGGGEHHLFLGESLNYTHPDYQLEVDDVPSALFAIDFVTEQGEGGVLDSPTPSDSHFDVFLRIEEALAGEYVLGPGGRRMPWEPAHPVLRNPTLRSGDAAGDPVTDEEARAVADLFNRAYALMAQLMAQHFGLTPDKSLRRSRLMNASLDIMTGVLRPVAEHLVTLPAGRPGRTAGPTFETGGPPPVVPRADVALRSLAARCAELADLAAKIPELAASVEQLLRLCADQFSTMDPREL
ncbi:ferritin-like domain-containing protein [Streptomyces johnsoniae]|uniref:Ferritin-like domain-containing protein n=1 Tax=Streptomyces johnsoniae TaxID=3075532 RepID=A0ABU2SCZ4_9ACTN|nr:ferritin-like domain-containing protein [Streptomyces sp. DSM 41886]MDT0446284.1 ferritin-like domain-containing protein [Streptomyces sp. DSM 41886]